MSDDLIQRAQQQAFDIETKKLLNAQADSDDNSDRIRKLEEKVANLSLLSESLWELLTKKTKLTNEDLAAVIPEVMQQRRQREETKLTCVKCKMQNAITHKKCVYCGGELIGQQGKRAFQF
jgi:hypothetical protein